MESGLIEYNKDGSMCINIPDGKTIVSYRIKKETFDNLAIALCERYEQIKQENTKGYGEE